MSQEEKLAREAVQRVHDWLEKETAGKGGRFVPRLAIKFCGGCNPVLERGEVARKIREELAGARWVSWEAESDLVVVINGCPTACAEGDEICRNSKASLVIHPGGVSPIEKTHRA